MGVCLVSTRQDQGRKSPLAEYSRPRTEFPGRVSGANLRGKWSERESELRSLAGAPAGTPNLALVVDHVADLIRNQCELKNLAEVVRVIEYGICSTTTTTTTASAKFALSSVASSAQAGVCMCQISEW